MKKNVFYLLAAISLITTSCDPCPGDGNYQYASLAESLTCNGCLNDLKASIYENGVFYEDHTAGMNIYGHSTPSLEFYLMFDNDSDQSDDLFYVIIPVAEDALSGKFDYIDVSYNSTCRLGYYLGPQHYEDKEVPVRIDGYLGFTKKNTRCEIPPSITGYLIDLSFEFEIPAEEEGASPTSIKIIVSGGPK